MEEERGAGDEEGREEGEQQAGVRDHDAREREERADEEAAQCTLHHVVGQPVEVPENRLAQKTSVWTRLKLSSGKVPQSTT